MKRRFRILPQSKASCYFERKAKHVDEEKVACDIVQCVLVITLKGSIFLVS